MVVAAVAVAVAVVHVAGASGSGSWSSSPSFLGGFAGLAKWKPNEHRLFPRRRDDSCAIHMQLWDIYIYLYVFEQLYV